MNPQATEQAIRAGNPVPRIDDPPHGAVDAETLFALLGEERWEMTATDTRPVRPEAPRGGGRGMLLAAATFVLVVIVGISLAFTGLGPDDDPGAGTTPPDTSTTVTTTATTTEPTTTTTAAATTTTEPPPPATVPPADRAIIENALTAYSTGDVERLMILVAPTAELHEGPETQPNDLLSRETFRIRAEFAAQIGERFELGTCTIEVVISCDVDMSDDFTRGLGLAPATGSIAFEVSGGQITLWRVDDSSADDLPNIRAIAGFERWHQETYPTDPFLHWPSQVGYYYWERLRSGVEVTPIRIAEYLATVD